MTLSPVILEVLRFSVLESFEAGDYEGLRRLLVRLKEDMEPYRYRDIKGYSKALSLKAEVPQFRDCYRYLEKCLADPQEFDPEYFEKNLDGVIQSVREAPRLAKQLRQPADRERMKVARAGRKYADAPVVAWYRRLPPARQASSVRGLAEWMLDQWDSELEGIARPSERTLRRILSRLKSEQ